LEAILLELLAQADNTDDPLQFLLAYAKRRAIQESRSELLAHGFAAELLDQADESDEPFKVLRENILESLPPKIRTAANGVKDEDFSKFVTDHLDILIAAESQKYAKQVLFNKSCVFRPDFSRVTKAFASNDLVLMMQVADEFIFENLKFTEGRDFTEPWFRSRVQIACLYNDHKFFKRLGRTLTEPPAKRTGVYPDKLSLFLITRWMPWVRRRLMFLDSAGSPMTL